MTFHVGQRVCCVDASHTEGNLEENKVYTIRKIGPIGFSNRGRKFAHKGTVYDPNDTVVWLIGVQRQHINAYDGFIGSEDYGFDPNRFRPLVERKTDIGWAQKIVKDVFAKPLTPARLLAMSDDDFAEIAHNVGIRRP